jgi:hypothetical protein
MDAGISPLFCFILFYTKPGAFERFVKYCQIKANYANGWMLQWEYKRPGRNLVGAPYSPVREGD